MYITINDIMLIMNGIVKTSYRQGFFILKNHLLSNAHDKKNMSIIFSNIFNCYNNFQRLYNFQTSKNLYTIMESQNTKSQGFSIQHEIVAKIGEPQKKTAHHRYPVFGNDKNGQFNITRRFSQFDFVRNTLVARWPGCYIPTLPQKKFLGNDDADFVEVRKTGLISFLNLLKNIAYLWYSQQFQIFLRKSGQIQKQLSKFKQISLNQIIERYRLNFPQCFNHQITKQITNQLIEFHQYLKKAGSLLQNLQKMTDVALTARKRNNQKYLNLLNVLIPNYQKNCMPTYMNQNCLQDLVFTGSRQDQYSSLKQQLKQKKNTIIFIYEQIKRQRRQVLIFQQVLKVRDRYSAQKQRAISKIKDLQIQSIKINDGKQSFFSRLSHKSKQDQVRINKQDIQRAQQEEKNLALLYQVVTVLLGTLEIKRFKHFRQTAYYKLLKKFFNLQKQTIQLKRQFWAIAQKGNNENQVLSNFFGNQRSKQNVSQNSDSQHTEYPTSNKQITIQNQQIRHISPQKTLTVLVKQMQKQQEQVKRLDEKEEENSAKNDQENLHDQRNSQNQENKQNKEHEVNLEGEIQTAVQGETVVQVQIQVNENEQIQHQDQSHVIDQSV